MNESGAKNIIKNSSIIAVAQVIQIIFGVMRTKIIALILGPTGVGISGLYQSAIQLISSFSGLGLSQSIVKSVAESSNNDIDKQKDVINTSLVLVSIIALLGVIFTLVFSKIISLYTFGNEDYSTGISILSVCVFANLFYAHFIGIIQGLRKLKQIALISVFSSILGFFLVAPIYYYFGIKGIVPAIILISISNFIISFLYAKPNISFLFPKLRVFKSESLALMKLGIALALSGFFLTASGYFIRIFVVAFLGMEGVGYLNAATTITTVYLSLIFTAMSTDFYPRLSQINNNNKAVNDMVNEQILIGLLIAGPIIIVFISFSANIIKILYSGKFLGATELFRWLLQGTLLKVFYWPVGFILLAKGYSKIFILTELTWNTCYYFLTILLWKHFSLTSVGLSYLISYLVLTVILLIIVYKKTKFIIAFDVMIMMLFYFFAGLMVIGFSLITNNFIKYFLSFLIILISLLISYRKLNKILNIRMEFSKQFKKIFNK